LNPDDPRDPSIDDAYRATRREEPPRELDARILAAAHRAVDARPSPVRRSFAQRWRVPVAIAATVVLSATVTLMVYESDKTALVGERGVRDKIQQEPASPAPESAARPASERATEPGRRETQTAPQKSSPPGTRGAARAPAVEGVLRQSRPREDESSSANEAKREVAPLSGEPAGPGVSPTPHAPPSGDEQRMLIEKHEAPAAAPAPSLSRERALGDRPTARSERDTVSETAQPALQSPDDWLAEIRRLKQAGRIGEANRLLREFRDRFPDHPVPEDLR
jgi:hypothetical protein